MGDFKHRLISPIATGIDKGYNVFFTYGKGINDLFYYDFYNGILTSEDTYRLAILNANNVKKAGNSNISADQYIYIDKNIIKCYKKNKNEVVDNTEEFFQIVQEDDDLGDDLANVNREDENPKIKIASEEQDRRKYENNLTNLIEKLEKLEKPEKPEKPEKDSERTFIYFRELEWIANLYSGNKDEALKYIKIVKDLSLLKNIILIISVANIDLIKEFDFNITDDMKIYVGNPSSKEIKMSFIRKYLKEVPNETEIPNDIIKKIGDVAQAMSSSNKDLRATIRVYDNIIKNSAEYKFDKKNFEIAMEKISEEVKLDEVILDDGIKKNVVGAVDSFLNYEDSKFRRKGLILTGPPGTGKTFLIKAIASEKNCFFMAPKLADIKGEYVGHSSSNVKRIFEEARSNQPTIIFIDEADAILANRGFSNDTDSFTRDIVNQFLVEIDGMTTGKQKIFVIAATNRLEMLDSAIRSRLSESIEIGLPNKNNRKKLFEKELLKNKFIFSGKSFSEEIAEKTEKMSGRDIENFVKKLKEKVENEYCSSIENLQDGIETKKIFLEVLKDVEQQLIEELQRNIPVEVKHPKHINLTYADIIGYDSVKKKISRQADHLLANEQEKKDFAKYSIQASKGVLLYGPPGNAKTQITEATAKEKNLYYIKVISKDFANSHMEKQLKNIQTIFDFSLRLSKMCSDIAGVLLFFDEVDALAGNSVLNPIIRGTILDYLSGDNGIRNEDSRILFMAATNYKELLDEAFIRKGRIDEHLEMKNPSKREGAKILETLIKKDPKIEDVSEETCMEFYEILHENIRNKELENMILSEVNDPSKREQAERIIREKTRPSGATIKEYYNSLKNEAYYAKSFSETGKLKIDKELIEKFYKG